jgi:hypothetical protein
MARLGVFLLILLPRGLGAVLLGGLWKPAYALHTVHDHYHGRGFRSGSLRACSASAASGACVQ